MTYYNAIVKTHRGVTITYHKISNLASFVANVGPNVGAESMFFYELKSRDEKIGKYCGYWNNEKGIILQ